MILFLRTSMASLWISQHSKHCNSTRSECLLKRSGWLLVNAAILVVSEMFLQGHKPSLQKDHAKSSDLVNQLWDCSYQSREVIYINVTGIASIVKFAILNHETNILYKGVLTCKRARSNHIPPPNSLIKNKDTQSCGETWTSTHIQALIRRDIQYQVRSSGTRTKNE